MHALPPDACAKDALVFEWKEIIVVFVGHYYKKSKNKYLSLIPPQTKWAREKMKDRENLNGGNWSTSEVISAAAGDRPLSIIR